ncbi:MAG: GNAT family N-acetyltransferase [Pseudonocardiales bacterium]|nr:MAG: GNAT family N-acetyltransferase [Pseudonocardiales bacterium]
MTVSVRRGDEPDFWAIAQIWVRSWQVGYAGIVPQAVLDGLDPVLRHRFLVERATDPDNDSELLVATGSGIDCQLTPCDAHSPVAGFAMIGPWRDADGSPAGDGAGEIRAMYVSPDKWRSGLGRALMGRAEARLDALGHAEQRLWVLAANDRGRRFYESAGWEFDGSRQDYHTGGLVLPEVRYARACDRQGSWRRG